MRLIALAFVCLLSSFAPAQRVDVLVEFNSKPKSLDHAIRMVGKAGRVLGQESSSQRYRVEITGDLDRAIRGLERLRGIKAVTPVAPLPPTMLLESRSVRQMRSMVDGYKTKYQGYLDLTGQKRDKEEEAGDEWPGLDYIEAYRFYVEERAYPFDQPNWAAWDLAGRHRERMPAWQGASPGTQSLTGQWTFLGPRNLDTPYRIYYGLPPLNGRINGIAYDPTNPTTFYVTGAQGGVWKTTDNGVNFTPLGDKWEVMAASAVAVHPTNPNVVFVGTGDYAGSRPYCMGIMKSTDGGATWTNYGRAQFGTRAIERILIDPVNPQIVLVTTGRGSGGNGFVWRSTDGGVTWSSVINTAASYSDMSVGVPSGGGTRYIYTVGGDSAGGKIWRSANQGATWTQLTSPVSGNQSGMCIQASKTDPNTVYLLCPSSRLIFKSTNAGSTWTDTTAGFVHGSNNYNWSQGSYDFFLETSVANGNDAVYVGLIDVVMSPNGGATWQSVGGPAYSNSSVVHNDQQSVALHPTNPNQLLIGGDGGLFRFTYNPAANTWSWNYLSANLGVTQFYKSAFHPTNPNIMLGGTQDNATPFCNGNLSTWDNVGGGDGGFCAINPNSTNRQFAEAQNLSLYKTTNSWNSSSGISPNWGSDSRAFIAPFILDPNDPNLLYAGTNYLWRYNDSANSWTARLGSQLLSASGNLRSIAIAPGDGQRIYTGASDGQVWMTSNGGTNWTQINTGSPSLPNRVITSISVNPSNKNDVVITVSGTGSGHVYRCADTTAATRVWTNLSGSGLTGLPDIPANMLARDPNAPQTVWYVATDVGVFATGNAGATWANATGPLGLPNTQVNDVKAVPGTGRLMAATYGRGMWYIQLTNLQTVSGTVDLRDFLAGAGPRNVTFEFRNPGSTVPVYSVTLPSGGGGSQGFAIGVPLMGTYDMAVKGTNWLRQRIANITITPVGVTGLAFSLANGDVDGDNEVAIGDYAMLSSGFGLGLGDPGFIVTSDLNGDDTTDIGDFAILSSYFGLMGNP